MSYFILIFALSIPLSLFGQSGASELEKNYQQFEQMKEDFFKSVINKKNLKPKLGALIRNLDELFEKTKDLELKKSKSDLSPEANQMALDLVLLEPLEQLADSKMDKKACKEAAHLNDLYESSPDDKADNRTKPVEKVIKKVCSK